MIRAIICITSFLGGFFLAFSGTSNYVVEGASIEAIAMVITGMAL